MSLNFLLDLLYERFINSISTLFVQKVFNGRNYRYSHYEVLRAALQTPQLLLENIVPAVGLDLNVQNSKNMEKKKKHSCEYWSSLWGEVGTGCWDKVEKREGSVRVSQGDYTGEEGWD